MAAASAAKQYGLTCDSLRSAEVVLASGEVVTASASENPDLFWALRGGGGNFGVVTSFEFQAHPVGPIITAAIPVYAMEDAPVLMRQWRDWAATIPDEVTTAAFLWTVPTNPHMPEPIHGRDILILGAMYCGDIEEGQKVLAPVRSFGTPILDMSGEMPLRFLNAAFDFAFPKGGVSSYWKSTYVNEMSDAVIDIVAEAGMKRTNPYSLINIPHMGRGVRNVPADATAVAERSAPFMISFDANWLERGLNPTHRDWARHYYDRLQPHATGSTYLNFSGAEEQGDEALIRSAYGPNLQRLIDVKTKFDPANLFRVNQNIRPRA